MISLKHIKEHTQIEILDKLNSSQYIKFEIDGLEYYFKIIENLNKTRYRLIGFNLISKLIYNPILYVNDNNLTLMYDDSNTMYCKQNILYVFNYENIEFIDKENILNKIQTIDFNIIENIKVDEYLPNNLPIRYNNDEIIKLKERLCDGKYFKITSNSIFRFNEIKNKLEVYDLTDNHLIYGEYDFNFILSSDPNEEFGIQITKDDFDDIFNNMFQTNLNYLKDLLN